MNTSSAVILGIVVVLGIGGFVLYENTNGGLPLTNDPVKTATTPVDQNPAPIVNPSVVKVEGEPVAITSSSVTVSDSTAIVAGKVTPNGALTSYWYAYGTTPQLGSNTAMQTIGYPFVSIPAPGYITGLKKDTTYYFEIVAENQFGRVSGLQQTFKTTTNVSPPHGSAPTARTRQGSDISETTANLNGEVVPNSSVTQFWFEYGVSEKLGSITALQSSSDTSALSTESISISGLLPKTKYYFRLNAQNQFGTVNGAILNFKTL